ncbi:MAG: hypothetical protein HFJ10_03840 [Lachnospiraceae bacterium]|nr:hypothetical protein [Lachnospiraceae bacterium]
MMKLKSLIITEKFYTTLDRCQGTVLLCLPDNTTYNLKNDCTTLQLLKMADFGRRRFDVLLTDSKDFSLFLTYMLEAVPSQTPAKHKRNFFEKICIPKSNVFPECPEGVF